MKEQRIWIAVVRQAFADAINQSKTEEALLESKLAIDWFFDPRYEEDRRLVADFSGEDISWWKRRVVRNLLEPDLEKRLRKSLKQQPLAA